MNKTWQNLEGVTFHPREILDDISIIIPTLSRPILSECLFWIACGENWPSALIIVDQSSNPEVDVWVGWLRRSGLDARHICSDKHGRSTGINCGFNEVTTRFVAVTDDDCFVNADWLGLMTNALRNSPESIITGRVEPAGDDMVVIVTSPTPAMQYRPRLKFDSMSGGNMGTSLAVIKRVGLFDEDPCMSTAEDAEWAYRALRKGISIIYNPDICVQHYGWRDPVQRVDQYRHYALSHGGFYGKYLRKGDLLILIRVILHYMRALRRWIKGKITGNMDYASIGRAYCLYLLPGIVAGFLSRVRPGELK